jgi:uroporphyrinogen decarboxylase
MHTQAPNLIQKAEYRPLLKPFIGQTPAVPPLWLMRQAGRYLPEYRATRSRAGSFLDLCYSPKLAAEVTLQPIRRFGFDGAIIFSDILVVPHALGVPVTFLEGEGPRLQPLVSAGDVRRLKPDESGATFDRVYEAIEIVRAALPAETALIGFCGAPWTVATYMVAGRGTPDQAEARLWAYRDPVGFAALIDVLVEVSVGYLDGQIGAGADMVQIFDSWAGSLPDDQFERWVIEPTRRIVSALERRHPGAPVIGFPRGAGDKAARYARETGVSGLGCDTGHSLAGMGSLGRDARVVVQGNLDPLLLVAGGRQLEGRVAEILAAMAGQPFIFNLGHGILPETPVEHVARLVALVRGGG